MQINFVPMNEPSPADSAPPHEAALSLRRYLRRGKPRRGAPTSHTPNPSVSARHRHTEPRERPEMPEREPASA